jgi:hypothetical protein
VSAWFAAWRSARRKPLFLAAHVLALAAILVVVVVVITALGRTVPGGRTVSLGAGVATDATPGRHWYDATSATGLAAELAAALDGTDWCAGWAIGQSYEPGPDLVDVGSNLGVDRSARACPNWAEVHVSYVYTSATSNLEDNAGMWVEASDPAVRDALDEHGAFALSRQDLLHEDLGHNGDDVIGNAIAALPLALAEAGRIDPLTVEPVTPGTAPDGAGAGEPSAEPPAEGVEFADSEGWGGSDVWRAERGTIVAGAVLVLLGLAGLCLAATGFRPPPTPVTRINPRRALKAAARNAPIPEETPT